MGLAMTLVTAAAVGTGRDMWNRARAAEAERRQYMDEVLSAQDAERHRIALELHDGTGQLLTSLVLDLRALEESTEDERIKARSRHLRDVARSAMEDIRRIGRGLHPAVLEELGLVPALERYGRDFANTLGLDIDVEGAGFGSERLDRHVELALYRIAQEALTNAARHASAHRVCIVLERRPKGIRMIVEDDGVGLDARPRTAEGDGDEASRQGLGLIGIRERVRLLDGLLTIESPSAGGTTLYLEIPLGATPSAER